MAPAFFFAIKEGPTMRKLFTVLATLVALSLAAALHAAPPYDLQITYTVPATSAQVDGLNGYIDDCAVTGATGSPAFTIAGNPGSYTANGVITADGSYTVCLRPFNVTGEQPDPGITVSLDISQIPVPDPVDGLTIDVICRDGSGAVIACASSGVEITIN